MESSDNLLRTLKWHLKSFRCLLKILAVLLRDLQKIEFLFKQNSRKYLQVSISMRAYFIGKELLEELKSLNTKKAPILTAEEKASALNEAEIKGTGF